MVSRCLLIYMSSYLSGGDCVSSAKGHGLSPEDTHTDKKCILCNVL